MANPLIATTAPQMNMLQLTNPAAAMQLQQQQALAAQLMQQGEAPVEGGINRTAAGGVAIPYTAGEGLGKLGSMLAGAYLAKETNQKIADALQNSQGSLPAITGDKNIDNYLYMTGKAGDALAKNAEITDQQKNLGKDAAMQLEQNKALAAGLVDLPSGRKVPANSLYPQLPSTSNPQPAAGYTPPQVISGTPTPAPQITSRDLPPGVTPTQMNDASANPNALNDLVPNSTKLTTNGIETNKTGNIQYPDTKAGVAAETKKLETEAADAADSQKAYIAAIGAAPAVNHRFATMIENAPNTSHGLGVNNEGDGFQQTLNKQFNTDTAKANSLFGQASKQGTLAEIGPSLANAGVKGNKMLENIIVGATGIDASEPSDTKISDVYGLHKNYYNTLKSLSNDLRAKGINTLPNGDPVLTEKQIDELSKQGMPNSDSISAPSQVIKYDATGKRL